MMSAAPQATWKAGRGESQFGVENGEARVDQFRIDSSFEGAFFLGDDRAGAGFTTGGRNGEDRAYRQSSFGGAFAQVKIPDVVVDDGAHGDGLGRINDATAADGQDQAQLVLFAEFDAFVNQA